MVAGGGTGGHVAAGIALADTWLQESSSNKIVFVGAKGGIEEKLLKDKPYQVFLLRLGALKRVSILKRFTTLCQLPLGLLMASVYLLKFRPKVVIGVGGYASGPILLMNFFLGWLWGSRSGILEQNSVPGFTNRVLSRFVKRIFIGFQYAARFLPKNKIVMTGNPVRQVFSRVKPASVSPFCLFVFGGSQGALGMNTVVLEALPFLEALHQKGQPKLKVIHQTGTVDLERVRKAYQDLSFDVEVTPFIYDMQSCYAEASLVVCRAGSTSLAELAAVGRAAVLIPLPTASDDHQRKNAQELVEKSAALMFEQVSGRGEELARLIEGLWKNPSELHRLEENISKGFYPQSAQHILRILSSD